MPRPVYTVPCPTCPGRFRPLRKGPRNVSCPKCRARRDAAEVKAMRAAMRDITRALSMPPPTRLPRVFRVLEGE